MKEVQDLTAEELEECMESFVKKGWFVLDHIDETGLKYYNLTPLGKMLAKKVIEDEKRK